MTFRVFVSSTFSDLESERDTLQWDVFPRLREYCQKRGCRFQAIDLRWGVSEEAALDQQTMNVCLEDFRCCQRTSTRPNFIVPLGQRYSWCPLRPQIAVAEFEPIRDQITATEDMALLEHWHATPGRPDSERYGETHPAVHAASLHISSRAACATANACRRDP